MHDHAPKPTGSDLDALNDSELRALLTRVQSELGRRAVGARMVDGDGAVPTKTKKHPQRRVIKKMRKNKRANRPVFDGFNVVRSPEASLADIRKAEPRKTA